jgi:hypothetical protein
MNLAARVDDFGKPAWIALMILGFIVFWPIGLAILGYMIWSRRMGCWHHGRGHWYRAERDEERQAYRDMKRAWKEQWRARWMGEPETPTSGNRAFDEYRNETLQRLEDEQREFKDFLERLRHAKDKAEFDQFMSDRRNRPQDPPPASV